MPKVPKAKSSERFSFIKVAKDSEENSEEDMATANEQRQAGTSQPQPQPAPAQFVISVNELIKDAQRIHEFRGDGEYALSSFLREVETILPLLNNQPQAKLYVYQRIIINKIQGQALDIIRTLRTDASWENIKSALISNFGVKETYHQLYHQALSTRNYQVREYFIFLRNILAKLNEKYEYDSNKPVEFQPRVNESMILRTFVNNIDPNLASIIINRDIQNIREAFNTLENLGMIRDKIKVNNSGNQHKSANCNYNKNQCNFRNSNNYFKQSPRQPRQTDTYEHRQTTSGQSRRSNNYNVQNNNPGHTARYSYNYNPANNVARQNFPNRAEPMDVDHVQHEANFLTTPRKFTYR